MFGEDHAPAHFGDAELELRCAFESCALFDRSDLTRLLGTGPDLLDLLHRLSTGDVKTLGPGSGKPTVLTTSKGRIVELLSVHNLGGPGVMLLGGRGCAGRVMAHLGRYTFAEQTGLGDVTEKSRQFALIGPAAEGALEACGLPRTEPYHAVTGSVAGSAVHVVGANGFDGSGYSILASAEDAGGIWRELREAVGRVGGHPAGAEALEAYRVLRGLPVAGRELTDERNPLEAGLREAVSFDKGCYVGQEVVARLQTYDKVSRSLIGLKLRTAGSPEPGTPLLHEGRSVGVLTSLVLPPGHTRPVGLGYVKRREVEGVHELQVGEKGPFAELVALPFP